jgi:hypothetical protein
MMLHIVAYARCFARSVLSQRFVELRSFAAKFCPTVEKDREKFGLPLARARGTVSRRHVASLTRGLPVPERA